MSTSADSQDHRVSICIKLDDAPEAFHSLRIDIGKDIIISYDTPVASPLPEEEDDALICWTCNRPGHFSRQCLSDRVPTSNACYECGATDHYAWQCHIPLRSPFVRMSDTYVCMVHNKSRGKLNVFKAESGGWQCKTDASCPDLV